MSQVRAELDRLFREGFTAKDVERLRAAATGDQEREVLARELDGFLRRAAVTLLSPQRAALWFQVAEAYRESGSLPPAIAALRRALDEDPTHAAAAKAWVAVTAQAGQWREHVEALRLRISQMRKQGQASQRIELHRRAAEVWRERLGELGPAFFELLRALRIAPHSEALWREATGAAVAVGGYRDLATLLEDLVERKRGTPDERLQLSRLYELYRGPLTDPTRAQELAERLSSLPETITVVDSKAALARAVVDLDELRRSEVALRRAKKHAELVEAYRQHEWALEADEREEKADVALMTALALGEACGSIEPAMEAAERAISHDPASSGAHRYLMDLWLRQGRPERALAVCERWAEACPEQAVDALISACDLAWQRLHDRERAERALAMARALAPQHPAVVAAEASLRLAGMK